MKSLDPRVSRLPDINTGALDPKAPLDQWGTFEVFVQPKEGKPFQHEGAVHSTDAELAFVLAKETFTRRFMCTSLFVVDTRAVFVTEYTDNGRSVYDLFHTAPGGNGSEHFEIFHLVRRGKQHVHAGRVAAADEVDAIAVARETLRTTVPVYNIWVIRTADIRFTREEERDLWTTLPDKKFRDASHYKAGDKLTSFTTPK